MFVAPMLAAALSVAVNAQTAPKTPHFSEAEVKAAKENADMFTPDPDSITITELETKVQPSKAGDPTAGDGGGADPTVVLDHIINMGKKIWAIIVENSPKVDVKTDYANALPDGVKSASQLAGWQPPVGTTYRLAANNKFGQKVIDTQFQVLRTYGGQYKGHGRFLKSVIIQPLEVDVLWGYRFSLDATVGDKDPDNAGTDAEPIAALQPTVTWSIDTPIKHAAGRTSYYVSGDGVFKQTGAPLSAAATTRLNASLERTAAAFARP